MFIGHYAVGLAGKRVEPELSLGTLFLAVQGLDLLWAFFVAGGIERLRIVPGITATSPLDLFFMPFSHGLPAALGWSLLAGLAGRAILGPGSSRKALVVASAVFSHWVLDVLVHRPDLPLWADRCKVGLGLWNHRAVSLALEVGMLAGGLGLALPHLPSMRRRVVLGLLCLAVTGMQAAAAYGHRPLPSPTALAMTNGVIYLLFAGAAFLVDPPARLRRTGGGA